MRRVHIVWTSFPLSCTLVHEADTSWNFKYVIHFNFPTRTCQIHIKIKVPNVDLTLCQFVSASTKYNNWMNKVRIPKLRTSFHWQQHYCYLLCSQVFLFRKSISVYNIGKSKFAFYPQNKTCPVVSWWTCKFSVNLYGFELQKYPPLYSFRIL